MAAIISAVWSGAVITSGYIAKALNILNVKYYVSQQLAQIQAHSLNKDSIIQAATRGGMGKVVKQIFKDYEHDIQADKWCWVKVGNDVMCIPIVKGRLVSKRKGIPGITICPDQRHNGIFPPIASIANALEPCTVDTTLLKENRLGWLEDWKKTLQSYATGYLSNLEFYVLQLEALEQDLSLKLLKV
tara:strand:+ start:227 stop:787 length:561 start_codon:yes stop_codon:yes gene_type:complete